MTVSPSLTKPSRIPACLHQLSGTVPMLSCFAPVTTRATSTLSRSLVILRVLNSPSEPHHHNLRYQQIRMISEVEAPWVFPRERSPFSLNLGDDHTILGAESVHHRGFPYLAPPENCYVQPRTFHSSPHLIPVCIDCSNKCPTLWTPGPIVLALSTQASRTPPCPPTSRWLLSRSSPQ